MRKILVANLLAALFFVYPVLASTAGNVDAELLKSYNRYEKAMHDADLESIITSYTLQMQRKLFTGLVLARQGREFAKETMKPQSGEANELKSFENVVMSEDGLKADTFAYVKTKLIEGGAENERLTDKTELARIEFQFEDGRWKLSERESFGFEEDVKRSKAKSFNAKDASKEDHEGVSGLVVKVDYDKKATVAKVRVTMNGFDFKEVSVFMAPRKALEKEGIAISPWKSYRFTGKKHKKDELLFLADTAELM